MAPRKDFRLKKASNVVSFKAGKVVKKSKITVLTRLTVQKDVQKTATTGFASTRNGLSDAQMAEDLHIDADLHEEAGGSTRNKKKNKISKRS